MLTTSRIALVGAGKGGKALLVDLIKIPGIEIKYVCDPNPEAAGIRLAKENNIPVCSWKDIDSILNDAELDLVLEVTGKDEVFEYLRKNKKPSVNLIGASTTKIIFYFLEAQQNVTNELQGYKRKLEERIIERTEQIEETNIELQKKVYEFEELNEKLQQLNDSKTKYILHATHQLKAPFAAIQSYADILLQGYVGKLPARALDIIGKVKIRCDFLTASIREMLELANLNSCIEDNINMDLISFDSIIPPVIESFSTASKARKISISYKMTDDHAFIMANKEQIAVLVSNILDNAITYSHDNSKIDIRVANVPDDGVSLTITDKGIGIPQDNIEKIFAEYFRSNNAVGHNDRGTGLGMSIVKRIADIHKCEIRVKSKMNKGTSITVIFPKIESR
ncbi:ATP-binding protein [Candidatus Omnitrophota bacterium]